jgi:RecB family endonuclease NucS
MLILTQDDRSVKVAPEPFANEGALQQYISANPSAIPLGGAAGARELHVLGREFSAQSGPIDVLGTDVTGHPYIIETELHRNRDKRTVLAQILDYGASLWAKPPSVAELVERLQMGLTASKKESRVRLAGRRLLVEVLNA